VIGGDAAGMSAASQARRANPTMTIGVLEKTKDVSYAACGMPYYVAGLIDNPDRLLALDRIRFSSDRKIDILIETEAISVDATNRTVSAVAGGVTRMYSWDKLVIATGARAVIPPIPGTNNPGVFFLRTLADGIAIREFIDREKPRSAVIIGGGFIGLEMAEAFRARSMETRLLERLESVAMTMSPVIRNLVRSTLEANGVMVRTGVDIESIERSKRGLAVKAGGETHWADCVLVSTGIAPNTEFLKNTLIRMNERGAVIVDERSRTNIPGIFAAGDCATVKNLITGADVYMPLGTTANKQGRVAGLQAAGEESEVFTGIVGSQMVKVFDLEIGKAGMNREESERAGIPVVSAHLKTRSRAGYYPSSREIHVILNARADTRTIIGGEVAGTDGAALRANVIAAAIHGRMRDRDLAYLDLGYAPPFSPVWDPVNAAAQMLMRMDG